MAYPVHWLQLAIGYESLVDDAFTAKPPLQSDLEAVFRPEDVQCWASGGHTAINARPTQGDHAWVAELIQVELNNALTAKGLVANVVVRRGDLVRLAVEPYEGAAAFAPTPSGDGTAASTADKDIGTNCKLVGGRWVNERTYRLSSFVDGAYVAWKPAAHTASAFLYATLRWACHPVGIA